MDIEESGDTPESAPQTIQDIMAADTPEQDAEEGEAEAAKEAETPAEPTKTQTNWEERYSNADALIKRQGNELGELRKQNQQFMEMLKQRDAKSVDDPWNDPALKDVKPEQRQVLSKAIDAILRERGLDTNKLSSYGNQLESLSLNFHKESMAREVGELRKEIGEEDWNKNLPAMQKYVDENPNSGLGFKDIYKLVSYDDIHKRYKERIQDGKQQRKEKAQDFGKTTQKSQQKAGIDIDALSKLPPRDALKALVRAKV